MSTLERIITRIEAGDRVKIQQDFYGCKRITLTRRWMPLIRTKVALTANDWDQIRPVLLGRRTLGLT
jgi:hypothetical protein